MEQLPRPRVLNFLKKTDKKLVVPYLEHVIWEWGDDNPLLHNELIHQYRESIMVSPPSPSSDETVIFNFKKNRDEKRDKLVNFLRSSDYYTAATILAHFPHDDLYEERALLLGRLGQHQQALNIYVQILKNLDDALKHCHINYTSTGRGSEVIVKTLLKVFHFTTEIY